MQSDTYQDTGENCVCENVSFHTISSTETDSSVQTEYLQTLGKRTKTYRVTKSCSRPQDCELQTPVRTVWKLQLKENPAQAISTVQSSKLYSEYFPGYQWVLPIACGEYHEYKLVYISNTKNWRKSYFSCFATAPFHFSKKGIVGLWQLITHVKLDLSSNINVNMIDTQCLHKTAPSSDFPTSLSLLLFQAHALMTCILLPTSPESRIVAIPEHSTAICNDSNPYFNAHVQHQNARLYHLFKNKIKQTLSLIIIRDSDSEKEKKKYYPSSQNSDKASIRMLIYFLLYIYIFLTMKAW